MSGREGGGIVLLLLLPVASGVACCGAVGTGTLGEAEGG